MQALSDPRLKRATTLLAAIAVSGAASADFRQYDFTIDSTMTGWSFDKSLAKFDTNLGTLTSVEFGLSDTMVTTIKASNMSASSGETIDSTVTGAFGMSYAGTNLLGGTIVTSKIDAFDVNKNKKLDFASPYGKIYDTVSTTKSFGPLTYTGSAMAPFMMKGPGSFLVTATAAADSSTTVTNGNAYIKYTAFAGANGYVRYSFQPTPEPASFAALAMGIGALVRRRKAGSR